MAKRASRDLSDALFCCPRRHFKRPWKFKALEGIRKCRCEAKRVMGTGCAPTHTGHEWILGNMLGVEGCPGTGLHYQKSRGVIQQAAEAAGEAPLHEGGGLREEVLGAGHSTACSRQRLVTSKGWGTKGKMKLSKLHTLNSWPCRLPWWRLCCSREPMIFTKGVTPCHGKLRVRESFWPL